MRPGSWELTCAAHPGPAEPSAKPKGIVQQSYYQRFILICALFLPLEIAPRFHHRREYLIEKRMLLIGSPIPTRPRVIYNIDK